MAAVLWIDDKAEPAADRRESCHFVVNNPFFADRRPVDPADGARRRRLPFDTKKAEREAIDRAEVVGDMRRAVASDMRNVA